MVALFGTIVMSETTVEVGGTEVVVRETGDGYEAEEVIPDTIMCFESMMGNVIALDISEDHAVVNDVKENKVVAYDNSERIERESDMKGNDTICHHLFERDWDHTWKFVDAYPLE